MDGSYSPPTTAPHGHLSLDVWVACYQEISGEAGRFNAVIMVKVILIVVLVRTVVMVQVMLLTLVVVMV